MGQMGPLRARRTVPILSERPLFSTIISSLSWMSKGNAAMEGQEGVELCGLALALPNFSPSMRIDLDTKPFEQTMAQLCPVFDRFLSRAVGI